MDLLCCERATETKAYDDPTLLQDRVFKNILKTEDRYTLTRGTVFPPVQEEVTQEMRKIVAEWMMEVCEEQKCQDEVFPLAMNNLDRFLMICCIRKNQLQLLGTACMLLASKLREPKPLAAQTLVFYTDNSITLEELWECIRSGRVANLKVSFHFANLICINGLLMNLGNKPDRSGLMDIPSEPLPATFVPAAYLAFCYNSSQKLEFLTSPHDTDGAASKAPQPEQWSKKQRWELLVLTKLKWDVAAITPQDFLRHILGRLQIESVDVNYNMVNAHAKTLIAFCAREFRFSRYNPSIIASACIASALYGVGWTSKSGRSLEDLLDDLHEITLIEKEYIRECLIQIDDMVKVSAGVNYNEIPNDDVTVVTETVRRDGEEDYMLTPTSGKLQEHETAVTPTDVRDVHF